MPTEKLEQWAEELDEELDKVQGELELDEEEQDHEEPQDHEEDQKEDTELERALADGWKPEDEYEGDREWSDFSEFNERGDRIKEDQARTSEINKMQKKIDSQNNEQNTLRESLNEIKRNQLIALESEMQEAISEGDNDRVNTIRQKQTKLVGQINQAPPQEENKVDTSAIDTWRESNDWVKDTDNPMSHFAAAKMNEYIQKNTESPDDVTTQIIEDAVEYMDKEVRKKTTKPNSNRKKASKTARGQTGKKASGKPSMASLTHEESKLWTHMQDWPGMTEKVFLEDVQELREEAKNG